ncbi:CDP-glucose 4,6-dehydratase [Microbacter margulisiae]|uniref:CDP-glucose 4,6-dehydratase n=1 Tax=Microbacter margulisiae TaxID=1350067 RepID=A0A7W5DQP8_9PORP|nr:CDP-glucose 4,6-dehydratase [Microbacter margulisiae]MBB3187216.1 CDP-glucose 4,6-dehydratase [Microbacter margulisiae]
MFGDFYKGKRVLITGHTGFKGSWLSLLLHKLGASVSGYALEPPTFPSLYEEAHIDELVTSFIGDIRDYNRLLLTLQQVKPEIVIHMAAQPLVRESYKNPMETYEVNVMGTVHLLEAIRHTTRIKAVVNVTTDKCYDNKEWLWGYRENEPLGGYDPYSNSKACSELVTSAFRNSFFNSQTYAEHGVAIASARAGNVIGGGDWAEDRLIPDFIRAITQGEEVKIRSPYAIRPWQHVLEPLAGYLMLAERLYQDGAPFAEAWNFGPDDKDAKNVEWIVKRICALWGNDASYAIDNHPQPHEATYLKLDCSKAKARLGWEPLWNIETTLKSIVDWNKAFLSNEDVRIITEKQIEQYIDLKI